MPTISHLAFGIDLQFNWRCTDDDFCIPPITCTHSILDKSAPFTYQFFRASSGRQLHSVASTTFIRHPLAYLYRRVTATLIRQLHSPSIRSNSHFTHLLTPSIHTKKSKPAFLLSVEEDHPSALSCPLKTISPTRPEPATSSNVTIRPGPHVSIRRRPHSRNRRARLPNRWPLRPFRSGPNRLLHRRPRLPRVCGVLFSIPWVAPRPRPIVTISVLSSAPPRASALVRCTQRVLVSLLMTVVTTRAFSAFFWFDLCSRFSHVAFSFLSFASALVCMYKYTLVK